MSARLRRAVLTFRDTVRTIRANRTTYFASHGKHEYDQAACGNCPGRRHPTKSPYGSDGIAAIPAVLEQLGADPDAVFARARVDRALFDDPANHIGIVTVGRLVQECINTTGCEHFGLLVGQQGGQQSFGLIGLAVRYSPDVATALRRLGAYQRLYPVARSSRWRSMASWRCSDMQSPVRVLTPWTRSTMARSPFSSIFFAPCAVRAGFRSKYASHIAGRKMSGRSFAFSRLRWLSIRNRAPLSFQRTGCASHCHPWIRTWIACCSSRYADWKASTGSRSRTGCVARCAPAC